MKLPLTRESFDDIVANAALDAGVPFDDDTRIATINFFHSLERNVCDFEMQTLVSYLTKAFSSKITFDISREIDLKRRAEQAKAQESGPNLSVVETNTLEPSSH